MEAHSAIRRVSCCLLVETIRLLNERFEAAADYQSGTKGQHQTPKGYGARRGMLNYYSIRNTISLLSAICPVTDGEGSKTVAIMAARRISGSSEWLNENIQSMENTPTGPGRVTSLETSARDRIRYIYP